MIDDGWRTRRAFPAVAHFVFIAQDDDCEVRAVARETSVVAIAFVQALIIGFNGCSSPFPQPALGIQLVVSGRSQRTDYRARSVRFHRCRVVHHEENIVLMNCERQRNCRDLPYEATAATLVADDRLQTRVTQTGNGALRRID